MLSLSYQRVFYSKDTPLLNPETKSVWSQFYARSDILIIPKLYQDLKAPIPHPMQRKIRSTIPTTILA